MFSSQKNKLKLFGFLNLFSLLLVSVFLSSSFKLLQVNINKQKKDAFQILKPELDVDPESNPHFDSRMGIDKNKLLRPKRMNFQFVEEGKWSRDAEIIKLKVFLAAILFPS